jgi:hypothetical protein
MMFAYFLIKPSKTDRTRTQALFEVARLYIVYLCARMSLFVSIYEGP